MVGCKQLNLEPTALSAKKALRPDVHLSDIFGKFEEETDPENTQVTILIDFVHKTGANRPGSGLSIRGS